MIAEVIKVFGIFIFFPDSIIEKVTIKERAVSDMQIEVIFFSSVL